MRFECDACGETSEAGDVRLVEGATVLVCDHCGHGNRLVESSSRRSRLEGLDGAGQAELPPIKCPKCFHRQRGGEHCERCGLELARAEELAHRWALVAEGKDAEVAEANALFAAVERDPTSDKAHERFLDYCAENQLLELAVRRYRARIADHPGEVASVTYLEKAVHRLETVALSLLATDRWSEDLAGRVHLAQRILLTAAAVLLLAGLVMLLLTYLRQRELLPF